MTSTSSTYPPRVEKKISELLDSAAYVNFAASQSDSLNPHSMPRVMMTTRLDMLEQTYAKFQEDKAQLLDMKCDNVTEHDFFRMETAVKCQQAYEKAKVALLIIKEHYDQVEPTGAQLADTSACGTSGSSSRRALPDIPIPTFNGSYDTWRDFHDMFVSLVGSHSDISAVEKMHYLRTSLRGDALQLIANLPVSSESFVSAWDMLVARYENKRLLINAQLDKLFALKSVSSRSAKELNTLINTTTEILNALRALDVPVDHCSTFLVHLLVSRLDSHLREQWEVKLGSSTTPATLKDLRSFLVTRARAFESIEAGRSAAYSSVASKAAPTKPSVRAHVASAPSSSSRATSSDSSASRRCHFCSGAHFIAACPDFKKKTPRERREIVISKRLCFNCLGPHSVVNCRIPGRCFECKHNHHTLIHLDDTQRRSSPSSPATSSSPAQPVATSSPQEQSS